MKILEIPFSYKDRTEKCVLVILNTCDYAKIAHFPEKWLSNDELKKFNAISSEKTRMHFALGRVASKKALNSFENIIPDCINIKNENNGCPNIENSLYCTSISHSRDIIASLVFKNEFSFGIDVEYSQKSKIKALKHINTDKESIPDDIKSLTVCWTIKEALGKAIKCGFSIPFSEFEISKFSERNGIFECKFEKHQDFKGIAIYSNEKSLAISCKREYIVEDITINRMLQLFAI
ncbi:MAG: 4'-phosphopantetheinyl transferase superfamily protein [Holosporaceae bacterium]|jgi:4'-phosphopantetheinyl transferase|nr:4'-phosphopantetheinyl transferase superfamily protein [Holosporaceae bacterium]